LNEFNKQKQTMGGILEMLTDIQIKAAQLLFEDILTDEQIATECSICRTTLFYWKQDKEFQEYLTAYGEEAKKEATMIFAKGVKKAAKKLVDAVENNKITKTQIDASREVLDRAGLRPTEKKDITIKTNQINGKPVEEMTDEELDQLIKSKQK
jgi:hypothetical protein